MPFVPTAFADATAMSWPAVAANNALFRTWANGVPVADINAGTIRREHLAQPEIDGFPLGGFQSTLQLGVEVTYGLGEPTAMLPAQWGPRRRRLIMKPEATSGQHNQWYFPIGKTIRLTRDTDVEAHCTLEWETRGIVVYPNGAGVGTMGGFLALHSRDRATGTELFYGTGRQDLYGMDDGGAGDSTCHQHGTVSMVTTLAAGVWDIMLVYHKDPTTPVALKEFDFSRIHFTLEGL